jgi:hypothetical protein
VLLPTSCTSSYSVTGDGKQVEFSERSDKPSKQRRLDSVDDAELLELARRASERRNSIIQEIATLDQLSDVGAQFSNPTFYANLLFPFVGTGLPKRFKVDTEYKWFYMGREKFTELLNNLQNERWGYDRTALWVYGTKGYGKSHLLAALAYYLSAKKERVVYIPDCRECLKEPISYFQAALLFAWADDNHMQRQIMRLNTLEEMYRFFKRHKNIIFIIDQMNALAETDKDITRSAKMKGDLRVWIDKFKSGHKAFFSISANYQAYLQQSQKETTEDTMHVYGGLTAVSLSSYAEGGFLTLIQAEMKQWWERNKSLIDGDSVRGCYTKDEVEDFTGCIPLLLESCVVDGKIDLHVEAIESVWDHVARFIKGVKKNAIAIEWERYATL